MPQLLNAALMAETVSVNVPDAGATALGALASGPAARTSGAALRVLDIATGRVTGALTNTTTTLADMTSLGVPVVAGGIYLFEFSGDPAG